MRFQTTIIRLLALVTTCLLVSCIDGREEVWLNADGSGRTDITYSLPAAAARFQGGENGVKKMIGDFLSHTPVLKNPTCEVTTVDGRLTIRVQASFDSALDLKDISEGESMAKLPSSASGLTGSTLVTVSGRTVDFSRTISAGDALPGSSFMPASQFEGRRLTYIMHLPMAALQSNATRTENEGRTLVWDIPLAQAIKGPVATRFKANVPVPVWLLASAGTVTFAAGFLGLFTFRKLRSRKQPENP
jgi:hypothetical protein